MMDRILEIGCVNMVKIEEVNAFNTSLFENVYRTALNRIDDLITVNEELKIGGEKERYCNSNERSNVISFMGERGMGKSSAMLSLAYFLKKNSLMELDHTYELKNKDTFFCVLPKVDAGLLTRESVFDDVLAVMWNMFCEKYQNADEGMPAINRTKDRFNRIKDAYSKYYADEKNIKNLTSVRQLEELAGGLRLRDLFADLVQEFLECMGNQYDYNKKRMLVIPIDDLDLASKNMIDVLEQLLVFLSVPNVIILTTLNIDKMILSCKKKFAEEHLYKHSIDEYELQNVKKFAEQYVAKALPRNNRIYMPKLGNDRLMHYVIPESYYNDDIKRILGNKKIYAQEYANIIFSKYTMFLAPLKFGRVNEKSLRNYVNKLNELWRISNYDNEHIQDHLLGWMEKDINIERIHVTESNSLLFLDELIQASPKDFNRALIEYLSEVPDIFLSYNNQAYPNGFGYGRVLMMLRLLESLKYTNNEFVNVLAELYSYKIAKCLPDTEAISRYYAQGDILTSIFEMEFDIDISEKPKQVANLFDIKLAYADSFSEIVRNNKKTFDDIFIILLFFDAKTVLDNITLSASVSEYDIIPHSGEDERKKNTRVFLKASPFADRLSIDKFFENILNYDRLYEKYLGLIYEALRKVNKTQSRLGGKRLTICRELETDECYEMFLECQQKWEVNDIYDLIPIQNVNVILDVLDDMKRKHETKGLFPSRNNIHGAFEIFFDSFIETFKTAEMFLGAEEKIEKKYSEKMECVKKLLRNKSINNDIISKFLQAEDLGDPYIDSSRG